MTHRSVQLGVRIFIGALVVFMLGDLLYGQPQTVVKGFRVAEPYAPPHQNQIKYILTGAEGLPLTDGKVLLKDVKLETFATTGQREAIASAPECIVDTIKKTLSSAGPMQLQTADGKFFIQGKGFLLEQTNLNMVISNEVQTTLHNDLLVAQTFRTKSDGSPNTNLTGARDAPIANPNAASQITRVFSDHADFSSVSNLAVYSSNVRVGDSKMDLTCEMMTLRRSTNGSLESIVAETNVVIVGKQDHSRATGERAVYIVNPEKETVELIGSAHWQDDQREAKADTFLFDRKDNTVRAEPNAYLKLPRATLSPSGPLSPKAVAQTSAPLGTNEFIEMTSQVLIMQLPTTNRPGRVMIARTNVVILSPADDSRGTGNEAVYTETNGTFRLSGKARWVSDQRLVTGDALTFDRTNQIFSARGNAYLRLPMTTFGKSTLLAARSADSTNRTALTNQFLELFSDNYDYGENLLNFRENVRANLLEGEIMNGWLTCGLLTVQVISNQVKSIVARQNVAAGQVPPTIEDARQVYKKLNCEILTVNFSTNGQAESFVAEQKVVVKQDELRAGTNDLHVLLTAEVLTGYLFAQTNQVERMVAERNVFLEQGDRSATGAKAVYTATNNLVVLSGQPTAKFPEGRITETEAMIWDRSNEKLTAQGRFKSEWRRPPGVTNQTNLRFPK